MIAYPVRISVDPYRGRDPKKLVEFQSRLDLVRQIEDYINEAMASSKAGEARTFDYWEMARDLNVQKESVKRLLFAVDGGSNGITVGRPKE